MLTTGGRVTGGQGAGTQRLGSKGARPLCQGLAQEQGSYPKVFGATEGSVN